MCHTAGQLPTVHKVWQEDVSISPLCVLVGQDAVVRQRPSKGIWNDDHDAFGTRTIRSVSNVAVQAMQFLYAAGGSGLAQRKSAAKCVVWYTVARLEIYVHAGVQRAACAACLETHSYNQEAARDRSRILG